MLWKILESYGSSKRLREAGGIHRPELDGTRQKHVEHTGNYNIVQARARLTPTLTHVVTYELVTSGAEDRAMSPRQRFHTPEERHSRSIQ